MDLRYATIVTGLGVIGLAPGYFRAQDIILASFEQPISLRVSACAPAHGNPFAELCKQVTEVGSDAFNVALFK